MSDKYLHQFTDNKHDYNKCIRCGQFTFAAKPYCPIAPPTFDGQIIKNLRESAFDRMDRQFKK